MIGDKQVELIDSIEKTSLPAEEVNTRIHKMEEKNNLLKYKVEDWCIWPILRFTVGCSMEDMPLAKRDEISLIGLLLLAIRDIGDLTLLRSARTVVKTYTSGLVEREGGLYKDVWFDDLLLGIGDYLKIEAINNPIFISRRKAALIKSKLTTTLLDLIAAALARISGPRYISKIANSLSFCIRNELGLDVFTPRLVKKRLRNFYWRKKIFTYLLKCVHPEYLLVADPGEHALIAAAKELKIKVVELQHGLINRYHYAYSWQANAMKHRPWMPIPDRLFLHGEYTKQELDTNGFWRDKICVVGSLRMDQYRQCRVTKEKKQACTLVFTTQGIDVGKTTSFMIEFLELIKERLEFRLYIKLHPVYETSKTQYENAFQTDSRVKVLLGIEEPSTYDLLTLADFHLSVSSTCHYDALGLGVPTVILPFSTYKNVLPLYEVGHAFLARTPAELFNIVLKWKDWEVPSEIGEYYFKKGALENMKKKLY
jgi:hypothetical protein